MSARSRTKGGTSATAWATDSARWKAVQRRDNAADGAFVFSVRTTGVYCRPGCPARQPRRENVAFHATCAEAERAGFRPCKRCRPNQPSLAQRQATAVAQACRMIEEAEEMPSLHALADRAGLSRFHFHRVFKAMTGLTPKAYAQAHRASRVRDALGSRGTVTEAIYGAGYNSSSRFTKPLPVCLG
jgi:AraC family transcriptional regulator of adaptative response/methylated-DNA-[protein]-cysteine methyltransferase